MRQSCSDFNWFFGPVSSLSPRFVPILPSWSSFRHRSNFYFHNNVKFSNKKFGGYSEMKVAILVLCCLLLFSEADWCRSTQFLLISVCQMLSWAALLWHTKLRLPHGSRSWVARDSWKFQRQKKHWILRNGSKYLLGFQTTVATIELSEISHKIKGVTASETTELSNSKKAMIGIFKFSSNWRLKILVIRGSVVEKIENS